MKLAKWVSMASIMCLLAVAWAGAATASAAETGLCKTSQKGCESPYAAETEITSATPEAATFQGSYNLHCNSTLKLKTKEQYGEPLNGSVTSWTWSSCNGFKLVTQEPLPTFTLESTGNGKGTLTLHNVSLLMTEGGVLGENCKITASAMKGTFSGSPEAKVSFASVPMTVSGIGCGTSTYMTGTWNINTAQEPGKEAVSGPAIYSEYRPVATTACKTNAYPCGSAWAAETEFGLQATEFKITGNVEAKCSSSWTMKTSKQSGEPLTGTTPAWSFSGCSGFKKGIEATTLPTFAFEAGSSGNGSVRINKAVLVGREGPLGVTCTYTISNVESTVTGGSSGAAKIELVNVAAAASGFGCGGSATVNGTFTITSAKEPGKEAVSSPSFFLEKA